MVGRGNVGLDIGRQNALIVEGPAWCGVDHQERESNNQQQGRYRPEDAEQRVAQQVFDPARLFGRLEAQVLRVMIIKNVVAPSCYLRADEMLRDEEIQRNSRVLGQHHALGFFEI